MRLLKYYRNAVLFPTAFMLIIMTIYSIIENHDYVSEWYTAESVIIISVVQAIIFSIIIMVFSSTMFLVQIEMIRKNIILIMLSWFLIPLGLIAFTWIHDIKHSIKYDLDYTSTYIYDLILTLPYLLGLTWTFLKYIKNNYRQQQV